MDAPPFPSRNEASCSAPIDYCSTTTPFTSEEACAVLRISSDTYEFLCRSGVLERSISVSERNIDQLQYHSAFDILRCNLFLQASGRSVDTCIASGDIRLADYIADELFLLSDGNTEWLIRHIDDLSNILAKDVCFGVKSSTSGKCHCDHPKPGISPCSLSLSRTIRHSATSVVFGIQEVLRKSEEMQP